jgi:hypothetical protein
MKWFVSSLILIILPTISMQEKVQSEITFCNLYMPNELKRANASFTISYAFEIGAEGKPIKISKVIDDYLSVEKVAPCLSEWHFRGIPQGSKLVASFRWQHGKGWDYLSISGHHYSHKIKLQEGYGYK